MRSVSNRPESSKSIYRTTRFQVVITEVIRLKATGTGAKSRIMIFLSPLPDNKWIQSLRCYFSVNNVFTLTGYTGGDPANINVNGVEPGIETTSIYPVARTFTLGLSVQF